MPLALLEVPFTVGPVVGEHHHGDDTGGAVDRRVVCLLQHGPASVGESLDDIGLPQRAGAVHRAADDAGHLLGELIGGAGRGEADVADVEVEIEVGVVHPVRTIEAERHLDQLATERLEVADERVEAFAHHLEGTEVRTGPLVHTQAADVAIGVGRLHHQEADVHTGELLHRVPFASRSQ